MLILCTDRDEDSNIVPPKIGTLSVRFYRAEKVLVEGSCPPNGHGNKSAKKSPKQPKNDLPDGAVHERESKALAHRVQYVIIMRERYLIYEN